jgi:hypothetical protein
MIGPGVTGSFSMPSSSSAALRRMAAASSGFFYAWADQASTSRLMMLTCIAQ